MKVVNFIKSPFLKGLTGCQLLRIIAWHMEINTVCGDFSDALLVLQKVTMKITSNLEMYKDTMLIAEKDKNDFYIGIDELENKKQKYIRQQHKLAQRHYRRK